MIRKYLIGSFIQLNILHPYVMFICVDHVGKAINNFDFEREFIKLRTHESLNTNAATDVTTIYEIEI